VAAAGLVFTVGEGAPQLRSDSQNGEIVGRHGRCSDRLRLGRRGELGLRRQTSRAIFIGGSHLPENMVCFAPCKIVGGGHVIRVGMETLRGFTELITTTRSGVAAWRTSQQESAHHAKHRGVHGDPQRQCDYGSACESRALQ